MQNQPLTRVVRRCILAIILCWLAVAVLAQTSITGRLIVDALKDAGVFTLSAVSSIGTLIVGAVAAYVAFEQRKISSRVANIADAQHKTDHDKLRLDLFEKRYAIYRQLMEFAKKRFKTGKIEAGEIINLKAETGDAKFLFGSEVWSCICVVYEKSWALRRNQQRLDGPTLLDKIEQGILEDEGIAIEEWFRESPEILVDTFRPYLTFDAQA